MADLNTLIYFNGTNGHGPGGALLADANGNLFGTTADNGTGTGGTVFEVVKTVSGYASTPTTLASFNSFDGQDVSGGVIADVNGDLFGTTAFGGASGVGTVFEIAKTAGSYASTPTALVSFNGSNGELPLGGLIADANGDLFGTTYAGGGGEYGTVFEIAKTAAGYASAPTTLASFDRANGSYPENGLIADANGNLFGTTEGGGDNNDGTVFEIVKTAGGYASTPTTLASFNDAYDFTAFYPYAALIEDANGDLFGTAFAGGANGDGAVFEVAKTASGYASTPITVVSLDSSDGVSPQGTLIADSNGDLFGTAPNEGAEGAGTVFEVTNSGFVVASALTTTSHGKSVTLGVTETEVTVSGYGNTVTGTGTAAVTVALTGLSNTLRLGDGNDTATTSGNAAGSTIVLGNGTDQLTLGTNNNTASLGAGSDTIALGGFNNTVVAGNGDDTVTGGTGHGSVTLGNGNDTVTLGGWDNSITLGDGVNRVDAGAESSTVQVSGGQLTLALHGYNDMVFLRGNTDASITDLSRGWRCPSTATPWWQASAASARPRAAWCTCSGWALPTRSTSSVRYRAMGMGARC